MGCNECTECVVLKRRIQTVFYANLKAIHGMNAMVTKPSTNAGSPIQLVPVSYPCSVSNKIVIQPMSGTAITPYHVRVRVVTDKISVSHLEA